MFIVVKGSEIQLRKNPILRSLSSRNPQTLESCFAQEPTQVHALECQSTLKKRLNWAILDETGAPEGLDTFDQSAEREQVGTGYTSRLQQQRRGSRLMPSTSYLVLGSNTTPSST